MNRYPLWKVALFLLAISFVFGVTLHAWFLYGGPYGAAVKAWRAQSPGNATLRLCALCTKRVSSGAGRTRFRFTMQVEQGGATRDIKVQAVKSGSGSYEVTFDPGK